MQRRAVITRLQRNAIGAPRGGNCALPLAGTTASNCWGAFVRGLGLAQHPLPPTCSGVRQRHAPQLTVRWLCVTEGAMRAARCATPWRECAQCITGEMDATAAESEVDVQLMGMALEEVSAPPDALPQLPHGAAAHLRTPRRQQGAIRSCI
jgi:hypothetical protein